MNILLTGAYGFLGHRILDEVSQFDVKTLGRDERSHFRCDLSSNIPDFSYCNFDTIIHNAGLAHIIPKYKRQEKLFFDTNFSGTINLTKGLENAKIYPKQFIFISTVAVYGLDSGEMITETHPIQPTSAYALSKVKAEKYLHEWCKTNNVKLVILRLPLIAGESAPGNFGRMEMAIKKGYYFRIGSGSSRKSIVAASDVAKFISQIPNESGIFNLTDGVNPRICDLENYIGCVHGKKIKVLPPALALVLGKIGDLLPFFPFNSRMYEKLNKSLTFDDSIARHELGWNPQTVVGNLYNSK